ncbi:ricin-type beta-trefoil lectin domain protein [Streptomyces sp. NBC_01794]|uniref:ricin-type beta-trefoil lectin domain protein n=1 Tax=Streptomyces sp. NBC_01794 TaxID=2975942 RepID=UPI003090D21C|nr:ricin-type beta-trefoil lectin domain protein [Streptomyces sp. NBC_01794]WSB05177.1 ricin-type beta-trefoil lectin domain protein [Streptomyces sp. NBC_01794]
MPLVLKELRRRHLPAVLRYARLCTRDEASATQLAAGAFSLAWQEMRQGVQHGPWRPRLLVLVHRSAAAWATQERRERLADAYAEFLDSTGWPQQERKERPEHLPRRWPFPCHPVVTAFDALPHGMQAALWHRVVEEDSDEQVARYAECHPTGVRSRTAAAMKEYREAYLHAHGEGEDGRGCREYGSLLEAAATSTHDAVPSEQLQSHLARCPRCVAALSDLVEIGQRPQRLLAEALLGWAGAAYIPESGTGLPPYPVRAPATPTAPSPQLGNRHRAQRLARRLPKSRLAVTAVAAALVTGSWLAVLVAGMTDAPAPPVDGSTSPATPEETGRLPPPTSAVPPTGEYTNLTNAATNLCLDVRDESVRQGADAVVADCHSTPTQQWRLDSHGLLHNLADPGYCLDSRAGTDRGLGIWRCDSSDARVDLQFFIDSSRRIRPAIAPAFAVTSPDGNPGTDAVYFSPIDDNDAQRWCAEPESAQ